MNFSRSYRCAGKAAVLRIVIVGNRNPSAKQKNLQKNAQKNSQTAPNTDWCLKSGRFIDLKRVPAQTHGHS
jgi:hypothetical protein